MSPFIDFEILIVKDELFEGNSLFYRSGTWNTPANHVGYRNNQPTVDVTFKNMMEELATSYNPENPRTICLKCNAVRPLEPSYFLLYVIHVLSLYFSLFNLPGPQ